MDLFHADTSQNILFGESNAELVGFLFSVEESNHLLDQLLTEINWNHDEIILFGKRIVTKRKTAWYGDKPYEYTYSNTTKIALPWTTTLLHIKQKVEEICSEKFNSCLLNLYHDGTEGMSWHSDDEKMIQPYSTIASVSFGASRKFIFKHKKTQQQISTFLENGSLLVMRGATQKEWLHALPKSIRIKHIRINLTFRKIIDTLP
jgi:alkylated DNA repair dioxygenase AlkB